MTRPQASTAILPIRNRAAEHRPTFSSFRNEAPKASESWFRMEANADNPTEADVYIMDEIGGWWGVTAQDFVKQLMAVDAEQINLHLNSPGGDVFDGVAIYNALRMHSAKVTVYVEGLAASAASFIAQAGDEVVMKSGSMMMIHDASAIAWGDEATMLDTASILSKVSNSIADIYQQRAGGTTEDWRAIMREEAWYTAQEAVDAKLADRVDSAQNSDAQAKAKAAWDLGVFNFAGRKDAPDPLVQMLNIKNRAKEAPVSGKTTTPSNEGENTPTPEAPAAPEAPSTEPVEQPDPAQQEETPAAPASDPVPATPEAPTTAPAAPVENKAQPGQFIVNGVHTSDSEAVQKHINSLEGFFKETRAQSRKDFINGLASGPSPKILATQIEAMEKLVATMSDEQYDLWKASWDAASGVPLLGAHGTADGGTPTGTSAQQAAARVETLRDIVAMHKRGGMKPENIEATDSFKELKALQPDFTLDEIKK